MCLFLFLCSAFELLCINGFELLRYIRSNEKYDVLRKMSWVWYSYSHFHKHGTLSYITKRNAFCLKRVVLLGLKSAISVEKGWGFLGVFFVQNPRKGGVLQTWARAWLTLWSGMCVCVSVWGGHRHLPRVGVNYHQCLPIFRHSVEQKVRHSLTFWYLEFSNAFYLSYWKSSDMCISLYFAFLYDNSMIWERVPN